MQSRSIRRSGQPTRASASRMRPIDRDLIRGGHYGQRSCEPHQQAEHMAAPTNAAFVKKVLANSEPSTHERTSRDVRYAVAIERKAEVTQKACSLSSIGANATDY